MDKKYFEDHADLSLLRGKTVAAVGFGTQGMAQALNIREQRVPVIVGEEPGSEAWARAEAEDFRVLPIEEVAQHADIFNLQIPDMAFRLADAYNQKIRDKHKEGDLICLSSGFNFWYGHIVPPEFVDAWKMPFEYKAWFGKKESEKTTAHNKKTYDFQSGGADGDLTLEEDNITNWSKKLSKP